MGCMDFAEKPRELRYVTKERAEAVAKLLKESRNIRFTKLPRVRPALPEYRGQVNHDFSVWYTLLAFGDYIEVNRLLKATDSLPDKHKTMWGWEKTA